MAKKKTKKKTSKKSSVKFTPFSKKNIIYARAEAYVFSLILIVMVCFGLDVSSITALLALSWAGYKGLQAAYLWMCKHEHLMEMKLKYAENKLDASELDMGLDELENEDFLEDVFREE